MSTGSTSSTSRTSTSSSSGTGSPTTTLPGAVWTALVRKLTPQLERFVRLQAALPPADRDCESICRIAFMFGADLAGDGKLLLKTAHAAGPGSKEQQLLFSLCCSVLKISADLTNRAVEKWAAEDCRVAVALAAAVILARAASGGGVQNGSREPVCSAVHNAAAVVSDTEALSADSISSILSSSILSSSSSNSSCANNAIAAKDADAGAAHGIPTAEAAAAAGNTSSASLGGSRKASSSQWQVGGSVLPWLVLFGRCCLQWASQLKSYNHNEVPAQPALRCRVLQLFCLSQNPLHGFFFKDWWREGLPLFGHILNAVTFSLQQEGITQVLRAAGFDPDCIHRELGALRTVCRAAYAEDKAQPDKTYSLCLNNLADKLQHVGLELTALPIPWACCNAHCVNSAGRSELRLVRGSRKTCGGCRSARFCSRDCLLQQWQRHKPVCRACKQACAAAQLVASPPGHSTPP